MVWVLFTVLRTQIAGRKGLAVGPDRLFDEHLPARRHEIQALP